MFLRGWSWQADFNKQIFHYFKDNPNPFLAINGDILSSFTNTYWNKGNYAPGQFLFIQQFYGLLAGLCGTFVVFSLAGPWRDGGKEWITSSSIFCIMFLKHDIENVQNIYVALYRNSEQWLWMKESVI